MGTALAGAMLTGYGRAIAGTCDSTTNPIVCSGPANSATDVTQTLTFTSTTTQANTAPGFGISTAAGDAIDLNGSGAFSDHNMSSITGAGAGVYGMNTGAGGLSITTTGAVKGNGGAGVSGYNTTAAATDLTINTAAVTGSLRGISAINFGTGALSVTASGTVTGSKAGIYAYEKGGSSLTIMAAAVSGGNSGVNAANTGAGLLSITTTGMVSGAGAGSPGAVGAYQKGSGIYAYSGGTGGITINASAPVTETGSGSVGIGVEAASTVTGNVTVTATDTSGTNHGIFAQNNGSGSLSITSTGTATGQTKSGIAAMSAGALTINANVVNGGASGIYSHAAGSGALTITTTGAVTSTGASGSPASASGIYALAPLAALTLNASGPISATGATSYGVFIKSSSSAGALSVTTAAVSAGTTGIYVQNGSSAGATIKATGAVTGTSGAGIKVYSVTPVTILVTTTGSAKGGTEGILDPNGTLTITNQGSISNLSGSATDVAISVGNQGIVNNSGAITGVVNLSFESTVNLTGGAVNGALNVTGGEGTVNFSGGTLTGAINMAMGNNTVVLTNLTSANLAATTHIDGGPTTNNTLTLNNVQYQGGSFAADNTALGVNLLTGWGTINLNGGTQFTLTGNLTTNTVSIDPSSTLFVGNGVDPVISSTPGDLSFDNAGTLDLTNGGVAGSTLTINGSYTQASTGTLVIGVTPTAIDLLTASGTATLNGTLDLAFAPGTYTAATRTFLTSAALTGTFNTVNSTATPTGFMPTVAYTTTNANLVLAATPTPTPVPTPTPTRRRPQHRLRPRSQRRHRPRSRSRHRPPRRLRFRRLLRHRFPLRPRRPFPHPRRPPRRRLWSRPNDATIYSADTFAFSQGHLNSITGLLSRTLSDGGGNTFYNGATSQGPGVRTWAQVDGSTLEINGLGANTNTTVDTTGVQGGVDVQFSGEGRIGVAVGYDYQWLHDHAGGKALENGVQVSLYGSQPIGPLGLSGVLSYAHGDDTVDRSTGIGLARATRDLNDYAGAAQLSAPFETVGLIVTPAAGIAVQRLTSSAFTESFPRSAAFAVTGSAKDLTSVSPFATVGFSHTLVTSDGVSVTPDVMVGYRYNSAARGQDVTLVAGDGTVFGGERTALSRSSGLVGASLTATKGGWTAFAKVRADLADGWNDESVAVGMRVAF